MEILSFPRQRNPLSAMVHRRARPRRPVCVDVKGRHQATKDSICNQLRMPLIICINKLFPWHHRQLRTLLRRRRHGNSSLVEPINILLIGISYHKKTKKRQLNRVKREQTRWNRNWLSKKPQRSHWEPSKTRQCIKKVKKKHLKTKSHAGIRFRHWKP